MTTDVGRNAPCPCGSGRKFKHCCEGKIQITSRIRRGGPWLYVGLALAAVAIAGIVFVMSGQKSRATPMASAPTPSATGAASPIPSGNLMPGAGALNPTTTTQTTTSRSISPVAGGNTDGPPAAAWTYDAVTNRHFDPSHNHWHEGPPPPVEARGTAGVSPPPTGAQTQTFSVNPTAGSPAASTGPAPAAWTFDAAKNQHWDPNHGHWHPGPPPAGSGTPK